MFVLILFITIQFPVCFENNCSYIGTWNLIKSNVIPIICLLCIIISIFSYVDFSYKTKGTPELPFKITDIEHIDYEHLTFLTTYIVPLVCFNFDNIRYQVVLVVLLVIIGIIYVRTDLFYANPTLAILQFRIYKVTGDFTVRHTTESRSNIILITKDKLEVSNKVKYIKLDKRIYYAKKTL